MLSRLVLKSGALAPRLRVGLICSARLASTESSVTTTQQKSTEAFVPEESFVPPWRGAGGATTIAQHIEAWDKANSIYYGPERDFKNFPVRRMAEATPPVRMKFIPEWFFDKFYDKTGVTGPYLFMSGLVLYLMNKEIIVVEHYLMHFITFWPAMALLIYKIGPPLREYLAKHCESYMNKLWNMPMERTKTGLRESVAALEHAIWQQDGQKYLFEAKRENVDLQLEATYRQRQADVHTAVKRRLDYQVDMLSTKKTFEQRHMVDWIINNVIKSITPQQEEQSITQCIADLKTLAAKA